MNNNFFLKMCNEAMEELASGEKGWREMDTNTLIMAGFGMIFNHLLSKIVKPMWLFAISVIAGVVAYIILSVIGIG